MPTLTFGAQIEWTPDSGVMKTVYSGNRSGLQQVSVPARPELAVLPLSDAREQSDVDAACEADLSGCYAAHGHFINMSNPGMTKMACGFCTTSRGRVWSVQNLSP